jgi:uncharacterized paraquat-inducible protein A
MIHVDCEQCGKQFEVVDTLAGGLANCPGCGKATPIPGLHDPYYRLLQVAMAVGWMLLVAVGWSLGGWWGAIGVGVGGAIVIGLIHLVL